MAAPNLFINFVSDVQASAAFYHDLFGLTPAMESPRFVVFQLTPEVQFALWSADGYPATPDMPRTSEICLDLQGGAEVIDAKYAEWQALGVRTLEEPHEETFGRTFVIADPDGNRIRVAPVD